MWSHNCYFINYKSYILPTIQRKGCMMLFHKTMTWSVVRIKVHAHRFNHSLTHAIWALEPFIRFRSSLASFHWCIITWKVSLLQVLYQAFVCTRKYTTEQPNVISHHLEISFCLRLKLWKREALIIDSQFTYDFCQRSSLKQLLGGPIFQIDDHDCIVHGR